MARWALICHHQHQLTCSSTRVSNSLQSASIVTPAPMWAHVDRQIAMFEIVFSLRIALIFPITDSLCRCQSQLLVPAGVKPRAEASRLNTKASSR